MPNADKSSSQDVPQEFGRTPSGGFRIGLISFVAAAVGALSGVVAFVLYNLIGFFTNLAFYHVWSFHFRGASGEQLGPWVIVVPVIGGLSVGLMAKYGSPKIRGHGIPEAMEAVLVSRSRIEPKVAILKPLSAAIAIGTGGPFGAEGPIIQTGGAFGSVIGQLISTTATERKVLLACGAGAGLAAMFNAPITGVLLAIELLLFEFRARSFIPVVIASSFAVIVRLKLFGDETMFHAGPFDYDVIHGLPFYLLLGVLCGFAAVGFAAALRKLEELFDHWKKVPSMLHPAVGALGLGLAAYCLPRVLGPGYDTIFDVLNVRLAVTTLVLLLILKSAVVLLSLGSGTSGGTLAPMFMISAAIGSGFALVIDHFVPGAHLSAGAFAVAAMGALLSASARATFTFMVCAMETTRDFHAVLPIMLVCIVADAIAVWRLPTSIMLEKFARTGFEPQQDYEVIPLKQLRVSEIMMRDVSTVPPEETVLSAVDRLLARNSPASRHQAWPIVDSAGLLRGLVTQGDLLRAMGSDPSGAMTVLDAGSQALVMSHANESVFDALTKMVENNVGRLPVVDRDNPKRLVGYINRAMVMRSWSGHFQEETVREHGWFKTQRPFAKSGPSGVAVGSVIGLERSHIRIHIDESGNGLVEEFALKGPALGVTPGDHVRIVYQTVNREKVALRVEELSTRQ